MSEREQELERRIARLEEELLQARAALGVMAALLTEEQMKEWRETMRRIDREAHPERVGQPGEQADG